MIPSDTIYLLSATYNDPKGDGNMYVQAGYPIGVAAINICEAKVFYTKQDAWNFREDYYGGGGASWQITPISAKKLFTKKLASK